MELIQKIDFSILEFIQNNIRSSVLDNVMPFITSLGNAGILWIVICSIFLFTRKYRRYGYMMLLALCICALAGNLTLKPLVARIRPFNANPLFTGLLIKEPIDFSFPSGHTMVSFAAATVIYYMNKKAGILAVLLSTLIAFSRLYLYVHYPSDVIAGMILGVLAGYISIMSFKKFK